MVPCIRKQVRTSLYRQQVRISQDQHRNSRRQAYGTRRTMVACIREPVRTSLYRQLVRISLDQHLNSSDLRVD